MEGPEVDAASRSHTSIAFPTLGSLECSPHAHTVAHISCLPVLVPAQKLRNINPKRREWQSHLTMLDSMPDHARRKKPSCDRHTYRTAL